MTTGSRAEVFHGNADATSGGLSKAASKAAKSSVKMNPKFMAFIDLAKEKAAKKDSFCLVPKKGSKTYKKIIKASK